ncbi:MAG: acyl--CoA ligase [Roseiflexaceae bacterium]
MATAFLAVAAATTSAPLNPAYRAGEFAFYLDDLAAAALVVQAGDPTPARTVAQERGIPILELQPDRSGPVGLFHLSGTTGRVATEPDLPQGQDVALILHTSGTTSRPKMVPLTQANLVASATNIQAALALSPADRCLNIMPLFHIHGLIGALLASLRAGASVVCTPGFEAPRFFDWLDSSAATWYTAVPTMHQAILARATTHSAAIHRSRLRLIRSASSALAPQVMEALEQTFGVPLIEAYGMTEASHQIASNPLPPGARKPGSVGLPVGLEVAILDADGQVLPPNTTGEIALRGANVTAGYLNNSEANAQAFTNGWFRTGDQGMIDSDGYVSISGRLKELINRGGEKIAPREIDEVLLAHPAIAQAVSFAIPHPLLGETVAAAVVARSEAHVSEREVRAFAAQQLADFKVPEQVVIVDEIPKGPTGKIQRIGLAKQLGLDTAQSELPPPRPYRAPQTPLETDLVAIWEQVLKRVPVGVDDHFLALGGDSVLAAQIVVRVRETFQIDLTLIDFFVEPTVAALALVVVQRQAAQVGSDDLAALLDELEQTPHDRDHTNHPTDC